MRQNSIQAQIWADGTEPSVQEVSQPEDMNPWPPHSPVHAKTKGKSTHVPNHTSVMSVWVSVLCRTPFCFNLINSSTFPLDFSHVGFINAGLISPLFILNPTREGKWTLSGFCFLLKSFHEHSSAWIRLYTRSSGQLQRHLSLVHLLGN